MQINRNDLNFEKENIQAFVQYFQKGCKKQHRDNIGIEIEHVVVDAIDLTAVSYYGELGIEALLERLSPYFSQKEIKNNHLISLRNSQYIITIEPAAQLEVSIVPQGKLQKIMEIYQQFQDTIEPVLTEWGYQLITAGYSLQEKSEELPLIPKKRYEYMNQYFEEIGMYGRCMMRGTASVQCAIDYVSEQDFIMTYRAAVTMGPLLALVTDNAPMFEGKPWLKHMARTYIWERVDRERCSIIPGTFAADFGFEAYARYLYQVPLIFMENENGDAQYVGRQNLQNLCYNRSVTISEMEHAMSIVFPDVRLKHYMEIRVGDSMPIEYALSYAAWIKGLFQNRDELYQLYKQLEQYTQFGFMTEEEVQQGKEQLIEHGYDGIIYGRPASYWLDKMIELAYGQLPQQEKKYLYEMKQLVNKRISVKDKMKRQG